MKKLVLWICIVSSIAMALETAMPLTGSINMSESKAWPGQTLDVMINIQNHAFTKSNNVYVFIDVPEKLGIDFNRTIVSIEGREDAQEIFTLHVPQNTIIGQYTLNGYIKHGEEVYDLNSVSFEVIESPLNVTAIVKDNVLTVSAENKNVISLKKVFIELAFPYGFESNQTKWDIGELSNHEKTTKNFEFTIPEKASGSYDIEVKYSFELNSKEYDNQIFVSVNSQQAFGGFGGIEWIILLVIAFIVIKVFFLKK